MPMPRNTRLAPQTVAIHLPHLAFSPVRWAAILVAVLAIAYVGLIAMAMSYAAMTVEFAQSVRMDQAAIARLESDYLATLDGITDTDYAAEGYAKPAAPIYVPKAPATALR